MLYRYARRSPRDGVMYRGILSSSEMWKYARNLLKHYQVWGVVGDLHVTPIGGFNAQ